MAKEVKPDVETFARIKVVGVGGSGGNAINHMISSKIKGVEFIAINTDAQHLHHSLTQKHNQVHIGKNLTKGLGTGMNPALGREAANETKEELQERLKGADMVFIACGMGGGTGTGASTVVAKTAKELGSLTVAVVTKPFFFEGTQRLQVAERGINELGKEVDAIIVVPNDKLFENVAKETTAKDAFALSDEILRVAVEGISDLITLPGFINVDFADVRAVLESAGTALMGVGIAGGDNRATEAAKMAINSPLLDTTVAGASGILFAIAGGPDLTMNEIQEAAKVVTETIDPTAKVIFGGFHDERLKKGEVRVTVIAAGFPEDVVAMAVHGSPEAVEATAENKRQEEPEQNQSTPGKIYNSLGLGNKNKAESPSAEAEPVIKTTAPLGLSKKENPREQIPNDKKVVIDDSEDIEDDWGSIPSFLRRSPRNK